MLASGWLRFGLAASSAAVVVAIGWAGFGAAADTCKPGAIGLSRTLEVDATHGPRFGAQYHDQDPLADGEVVLTFDDGPSRRHTQRILDTLDSHCTKATFFMVGTMALTDPAMTREVAARGHTVATHTWSHRYQLAKITPPRATQEIELGVSAVAHALGEAPAPFFRFPYLSDQKAALKHLGERDIATFSIDVDSQDFRARGPGSGDKVITHVLAGLETKRKGIILFHDIQPATVAALPRLLDLLKAKGFKVVHLTSKSKVATLSEYDAQAIAEAARRKSVVASQPLAQRAVTWSMGGPAIQQGWAPTVTLPTAPQLTPPSVDVDWRKSIFGQ